MPADKETKKEYIFALTILYHARVHLEDYKRNPRDTKADCDAWIILWSAQDGVLNDWMEQNK